MKPIPIALGVVGAVALPLADAGASPVTTARLVVLGGTLGAAAATDLAEHRIPNRLVLPAAAACAALVIVGGDSSETFVGLAVLAGLLGLTLVAPSIFGIGDIKLMLVVVLGLEQTALNALLLALVLAAVVGAIARAAGQRSLPLAPFLAAGSVLAVL